MLYKGNKRKEIIFPLGGIGTGSIGLAGNGAFVDWEIFNRPNKGSINPYSCFAIKAEYPNGQSVTRILQGDHLKDYVGQYSKEPYSGYGFGPHRGTMCGFPHFEKVTFDGKFPIATVTFEDRRFPAKVLLRAFNPFIPLDADNSSIPAAFFEVEIKSQADDIRYTVVLSVGNPFPSTENTAIQNSKYTAVKLLHHGKSQSDRDYGDLTVAAACSDGICQEYWYRGRWQDKVTTFWRELTEGSLTDRHYPTAGRGDLCSVGAEAVIGNKQKKAFRFVLSWNIPNYYKYWQGTSIAENNGDIHWKNYYASLFSDSSAACFYCLDNWDMLYRKTARFCRLLHGSTLDKAVIDAASSAISVLKSPTVLRLEDGTFYGWEGVHETGGSCEGTCTHVWSYAYALCFLFPELERSLRNTEFRYNTTENGGMNFRTQLPLGSEQSLHLPCVDGQMATVIKIYRDWKITGNSQWLRENWDTVKQVLEFAWNRSNPYQWDRDKDGVLEGRQHHTLDMELFGPSSWLQGMYLAALKAAGEMADFLGDTAKKSEYLELFQKGFRWTKDNLFNGSYFFHKVDLQNKDYIDRFQCPDYWNEEKQQLKYQIGDGSEIDQMLGQWHANICGLGDIFDKQQRQTALRSMLKNNFKPSLREFANMWRVFALNDEGGTVICDYPQGSTRPAIPIPYCEECMTGFEYAFAGLLIGEGMIQEGLEVIRAIRDRYDGEKRNPWNEIECGNNYARPMASFALLPLFSGMEYDLPHKHVGFSPILSGNFQCFWSLGTGWGSFIQTEKAAKIVIASGYLELERITLGGIGEVSSVRIDGKAYSFRQTGKDILIPVTKVCKQIVIEV